MITSKIRKVADLAVSKNLTRELRNRYFHQQPRSLLNGALAERSKSTSAARINLLLKACTGTNFLEIGVNAGRTFEGVRASKRVGVDPNPIFDLGSVKAPDRFYKTTSDAFFGELGTEVFDLVFVDGLHEFTQAYRDIINGLNILSSHGVVLVDDSVPTDQFSAMNDPVESIRLRKEAGLSGAPWHGTVFLAVIAIGQFHPELAIRTTMETPHQTIIFRKPNVQQLRTIPLQSHQSLVKLEGIQYGEVFKEGIPEEFGPSSFESILHEISLLVYSD